MAIAQVLDLARERPIKGEKYLVDTNVWVWVAYAAIRSEAKPMASKYQIENYPRFIEEALAVGAVLCHTPLILCELMNVIENIELDIHKNESSIAHLEKKAFRKIAAKRQAVIKYIKLSIVQVKSMSICIDSNLDASFVDRSMELLSSTKLDAYDSYIAISVKDEKIEYIITDDVDYCDIPRVMVVTANPASLRK
jgi:hypothetical protein